MHLRPATINDAELLFAWRNNSATLANSRNSNPIDWEVHLAWLQKSLAMANRKIYIAEDDISAIGTVRSDKNLEGIVELSWTIAPERRGQNLGKAMVLQFVKEFHPNDNLMATVRQGNVASERIAAALGLVQVKNEDANDEAEHPMMVWQKVRKI